MKIEEENEKQIYSIDVHETNKIMNGKKVYRAEVKGTLPSTSNSGIMAQDVIDITSLGATSIPIIEFAYFTNAGRNFPLPFIGGNTVYTFVSKTDLNIQNYLANYNKSPITVALLFNID